MRRTIATTVIACLQCLSVFVIRAEAPPGRYASTAETVRDLRTHLIWQRGASANSYSQSAAAEYCANLVLADGSDWRLPSRAELLSLSDPTRLNPAIDVMAFPSTPPTWFWSSSTYLGRPNNSWRVDFGRGIATGGANDQQSRVRCVR